MIKSKFRSGHANRYDSEPESPMAHIGNLSDIMLVLACGLMVAIIMFWQVDLSSNSVRIVDKKELKETDKLTIDDDGSVNGNYHSKGSVYEDPKTGKMYVVMTEEDE